MSYELIDSGEGCKLERFGEYTLLRPCAQAVWRPSLPRTVWDKADAIFTREKENRWIYKKPLPKEWNLHWENLHFKIAPTDFGHIGIFPEHANLWGWMRERIRNSSRPLEVLNLFAYSGGASLAAAQAGAKVCHLDASKGMVAWARENATLSSLQDAPIRWITDDVIKFLGRELKRDRRYDGIILDPPSFGRGSQGEVFKIEEHLGLILDLCKKVLSPNPSFVIFSAHTPGFTPIVMEHLLKQTMSSGKIESGEMVIRGKNTLDLPCGSYARWFV